MADSRALRWGIVGCGDVAQKRVAAAIQRAEGSELVAVCRRHPEKLQKFADQFGVGTATTNADEVLTSSDIDAVYLATPNDLHLPHTLMAAAAGKHVLVEKPMALSVAECHQMVDACDDADVRLGVAYYRRFYPIVQRIEQLISDGAIGTVMGISATTATPFAIEAGEDGYWRVEPAGGGGAFMDIGSHRLNLFRYLMGPATEVKAVGTNLVRNYSAENAAGATMHFESGAVGNLQCFFEAPVDPDEFSVIGSNGRLSAAPLNGDTLVIQNGSSRTQEILAPCDNFNLPQIEDFVAAVRDHRPPLVDGREGLATNELLELCYQSMSVSA